MVLILFLILHLLASYLQTSQFYFSPYARVSVLVLFVKLVFAPICDPGFIAFFSPVVIFCICVKSLCYMSETSSLGSWDATGMRFHRSLVRWDSSGSGDQSPFSLACLGELWFLRSLPWRWDFGSSGTARPVPASRASCYTNQEAVGVWRKDSGFFCNLEMCALLGALWRCSECCWAAGWVAWRLGWFGRGPHFVQSSQLTWISSY